MILANKIFFTLVIVSGLATLGVLFAGLISMSRGPTDSFLVWLLLLEPRWRS